MSFSFNVTGKTKAEAMELLEKELQVVVAQQEVHNVDKAAVIATATTYLDLLTAPGNQVSISVSGSVGYKYKDGDPKTVGDITGAGVNVSVRSYNS